MWPLIAIVLMWQQGEPAATSGDPLVEKARLEVGRFVVALPDYECRQTTDRYAARTILGRWVKRDRVSAVLTYREGRDLYRDFKINGSPGSPELAARTGSWLNGDFGNLLLNVFAYGSKARFRPDHDAKNAGEKTRVYSYTVDAANSPWQIGVPGRVVHPAFSGRVWISLETSRVLQVEMRAVNIPDNFPQSTAEVKVEYRWVTLGGTRFLLPARSEVTTCTRDRQCDRNSTEYSDFRKFIADSTITFKEQ